MPTLKAIHICNSHQPTLQPKIAKEYVFANADRRTKKNNEGITRVWQKWRFRAPQTHLWLIKVWFSASTFVVKIATFAKPETVGSNNPKNERKMRKCMLLFLILTLSCSSKSDGIESIEIMSYYYNLNEDHTEFKTEIVNYSVIDENGNVETIQKNPFPENSFFNFKSTINKKIIDKISLSNKNRNDDYYKVKPKNDLIEIYCGPINRIKIKYKNQKELTFNFSEYKTDSKHKEFAELQNVIKNNFLEKRFNKIDNPKELEKKERDFEKYSINKDTMELPFPPMPTKNMIKFTK